MDNKQQFDEIERTLSEIEDSVYLLKRYFEDNKLEEQQILELYCMSEDIKGLLDYVFDIPYQLQNIVNYNPDQPCWASKLMKDISNEKS
jgi:hypothetical protein